MLIAETLLNRAEEVVFQELSSIAQDNYMRIFSKVRLSDVLIKNESLSSAVFDFYTRAHVDFVVTDQRGKPSFIVEYDGPHHSDATQRRRDHTKDHLCANAGLGVLRVNANHVRRSFRGVTVLRWILEVREFEKNFYSAQRTGQIPLDEPFDPAILVDNGSGRKWPYWLSVSATRRLNTLMLDGNVRQSGWAGIAGQDQDENLFGLSFFWHDDSIVWAKTGVKRQALDFPAHDLLRELSICELDIKVQEHINGGKDSINGASFRRICQDFCSRYDAHPSYYIGGSGPVDFRWLPETGWEFR